MKVAIVSYASKCYKNSIYDSDRYFIYAERLRQSLNDKFKGDFYLFTDSTLVSPGHQNVPYSFKPYAINKLNLQGYDIVIWMDSCLKATKDLTEFIDYVAKNGYAFFDNIGFTIGSYTSDECLEKLEMTRDESFKHPMIMACLMGFNFNDETAVKLFSDYYKASSIQGCYEGDWSNHRHDQSVMSIILAKNNIKPLHPNSTFFAYANNPGHEPHAESVCLISEVF